METHDTTSSLKESSRGGILYHGSGVCSISQRLQRSSAKDT